MRQAVKRMAMIGVLFSFLVASLSQADTRIESDVVYGVMSGLSLAMDIYHPSDPLRRGIVLIPGSGWDGRERGYTSYQLKNGDAYINGLRDSLVGAGFTLFVLNTRMAPEHRFPAPVDDVRRAVRFIRHNAKTFNIEPMPIGAVGHSSGGHLAAMAGVLDDDPNLQESKYPEEHESSRVQAVVTIASPHDLTVNTALLWAFTVQFLGERAPMDETYTVYKREGIYAEASTVTHVTPDDAAFMLIHGDGDPNVTPKQLPIMAEVVRAAGLELEVVEIASDSHAPPLDHGRIATWLTDQLQ
ncbi:MAG: acetyl esterase/lipase [Woeseiaceae bacterium]|jgi:acetyl esterase/lipase